MEERDKPTPPLDLPRLEQTARAVRRQLAGLAVFGLLVLLLWLGRAGWRNVFTHGRWRW